MGHGVAGEQVCLLAALGPPALDGALAGVGFAKQFAVEKQHRVAADDHVGREVVRDGGGLRLGELFDDHTRLRLAEFGDDGVLVDMGGAEDGGDAALFEQHAARGRLGGEDETHRV